MLGEDLLNFSASVPKLVDNGFWYAFGLVWLSLVRSGMLLHFCCLEHLLRRIAQLLH